jgi:exonuclease SbcD
MTSAISPSSLRIAHCGDLHLGASYHLGDEDKGGVNGRLYDYRRAWVTSCERMVREKVDLVLMAGDAFDSAKPTPTEQAVFRVGLDLLDDAGIPVVMITGNHDVPRQIGRAHALAIFDEYKLVTIVDRPQVVYAGPMSLPVACFPYPNRAYIAAQDPEFEKLTIDEQNAKIVDLSLATLRGLAAEAEQDFGAFGAFGAVLLGHASISGSKVGAEGSTAFFREAVLPLSELRGLPFVAQCWGHLHRAQVLRDVPLIAYCGSIERTDFSEADEDKGWWLLDLRDDGTVVISEWHSSQPRQFVDIDISLDAIEQYTFPDYKGAIVRARYTATPEQAKTVDHAAIRRALYAAGAVKVHGPIANITHGVTEASDLVTEETDMLTGWHQYATLQGLSGSQRERLDRKAGESLEATCQA